MVHGIIIPADNNTPLTAATFGTPADYNRAVDGWAEAVHIPHVGVTMHLNLEGSNRQLPYNRRATFLWWFYIPAVRGEARILGNVALVGPPDDACEATDLPVNLRRLLLEPGTYRVSLRERGQNRWRTEPIERDDYVETVIWTMLLLELTPDLEVRIDRIDDKRDGSDQP